MKSLRVILLVALGVGLSEAFSKVTTCVCGQGDGTARIVGGQDADVNEWPWIASIWYYSSQHFCGGSLINDQYILTAAHCVEDLRASQLTVRLGEHNLATTSETRYTVTKSVSQIIAHEDYNSFTYANDIALLKLSSKVTYTDGVSPVCLPPAKNGPYESFTAYVYGWGTLEYEGDSPNTLQEVAVPIVPNDSCSKTYSGLTYDQLCAGASGLDSCQGDSGGPLTIVDGGGNHDQIGVVSYGYECAVEGYPGVYTRVGSYRDWIDENTSDAKYCKGFA